MNALNQITKLELLKLLAAAVDGIDGYESETGDLQPYWDANAISRARGVLDMIAAPTVESDDRPDSSRD